MRTANNARTDMNRRNDDLVRFHPVNQEANRRDIGDGVQRPDLVKMHLRYRTLVRLGFRFGDQSIYRQRVIFDVFIG